ncbi:hypothetical protein L7F22_050880 [Adiantum nelumboides]|nr:hypothetical protein [Adiantum nelumboides]
MGSTGGFALCVPQSNLSAGCPLSMQKGRSSSPHGLQEGGCPMASLSNEKLDIDMDVKQIDATNSMAPEAVIDGLYMARKLPLYSSQIVLANCGDSRAVLSKGGKAIPLSQDHRPVRADKANHIEAAHGRIIAWKGYKVGALLTVSHAIGDQYLKRCVVSEPNVVCPERSEEDECLILASNGMWQV